MASPRLPPPFRPRVARRAPAKILPAGYIQAGQTPEYGLTPTVYNGRGLLLNWGSSARIGMTVDIHVAEGDANGVHPFKGMKCERQHGQRLHVMIALPGADDPRVPGMAIYAGEAVLMKWSDDNINGMMVRVLLDDGPDGTAGRHPFDGLPAGKKDGEALVFVAWAVAEDDTLVDPATVKTRKPFHTLNPVKQSQILCRDGRFIAWIASNLDQLIPGGGLELPDRASHPQKYAETVVRHFCGVDSRAVMNQETALGEEARRRWRRMLHYYDADSWSRQREIF